MTKSSHKLCSEHEQSPLHPTGSIGGNGDRGNLTAISKTRQRYCTMALTIAIITGAVLMLVGYPALGKGLVLGTLFSILNFILMALALPMRLGKGRGKSFLFSIGSIYLRFAVMAVPLVWAIKQESFAVSTVAVGLFMVQIAILADHLFNRYRHTMEAG